MMVTTLAILVAGALVHSFGVLLWLAATGTLLLLDWMDRQDAARRCKLELMMLDVELMLAKYDRAVAFNKKQVRIIELFNAGKHDEADSLLRELRSLN